MYEEELNEEYENLDHMSLFINGLKDFEPFTAEEEREIFLNYMETKSKELRDKIANHNIRLVISIAKRMKLVFKDIELSDIIEDGVIGLLIAIDRFEPDLGNKFSTYATWWIRQTIVRNCRNNKDIIRIPIHEQEKYSKYKVYSNEIYEKYGFYPDNESIKEHFELTDEDIKRYTAFVNISNVDSLNRVIGESSHFEESYLGDFIADKRAGDAFLDIEKEELSNIFLSLLDRYADGKFDKRNRERNKIIIKRRLGLDGYEIETLENIGMDYGMTRERIRQIEKGFMEYLMKPHIMKILEPYR